LVSWRCPRPKKPIAERRAHDVPTSFTACPLEPGALDAAEPIYERLDLPAEALANLARLASLDEARLLVPGGWAARVTVAGTEVLVRGDAGEAGRWSILAPPGADDADAALAARKLHGLLGAVGEGWDLDR
jgi:hypothetical protein